MENNRWIEKRNLQYLYWSTMCGFIMCVGYLFCWAVIAKIVPIPPATWTGVELVQNYFLPNRTRIMAGMVACGVLGMLWLPHASALYVLMTRKEFNAPVLALTMFFGGGITAWVMVMCPMGWALAAYYAPTHPELVEHLWLKEWFIYDCTYVITALQALPSGIYMLCDKSSKPIAPRWVGWYGVWVFFAYLPLSLLPFYQTGPFAYDGWYNFWFIYTAGYAFYPISSFYMMRYIKREKMELKMQETTGATTRLQPQEAC